MRVVMFGPTGGHNVLPFIDHFERHHSEYQLIYVSRGESAVADDFPQVEFVSLGNPLWETARIKQVLAGADFVWFHGGYDYKMLWLFLWLKPSHVPLSLNIWGEAVPRMAEEKNWRGRLLHHALERCDIIHCTWHGTAQLLKDQGFHQVYVQHWGLERSFTSSLTVSPSGKANDFVKGLKPDQFKFFYPKSFLDVSAHDLIIEAASKLKQRHDQFKVYFWAGNNSDPEREQQLRRRVTELKLSEQIEFVHSDFLSFTDMRWIWSSMDCGLQLAYQDQLSTTFLEPLALKVPAIISQIKPYQIFEEAFGVDLPLIPLEVPALVEAMTAAIEGRWSDEENREIYQQIVQDHFQLDQNVEKILRRTRSMSSINQDLVASF